MKECKEILTTWLNNAYAMEKSMVKTLKAHADDAREWDLMELADELEQHVNDTELQANRLKDAIEKLGGDVSKLKEESAELSGIMQGVMNEMTGDKVVKNTIAEHAAEHFEMATYMAIARAAENCGEDEVAEMAKSILEEEKSSGEELEQELNMVVDAYMDRQMGE